MSWYITCTWKSYDTWLLNVSPFLLSRQPPVKSKYGLFFLLNVSSLKFLFDSRGEAAFNQAYDLTLTHEAHATGENRHPQVVLWSPHTHHFQTN